MLRMYGARILLWRAWPAYSFAAPMSQRHCDGLRGERFLDTFGVLADPLQFVN